MIAKKHKDGLFHLSQDTIQVVIDQFSEPVMFATTDARVELMNKNARAIAGHCSYSICDSQNCYKRRYSTYSSMSSDFNVVCPVEVSNIPNELKHLCCGVNEDTCRFEVHIKSIYDNESTLLGYLHVFHDVTHHIKIEEDLKHISMYDELTQLANRRLLLDRMEQAIYDKGRKEESFGVFFIDLDLFKDVNDNYGHEAGDQVLIQTAQRLKKILRKSDTVARLGGDEFVIMAENQYLENYFYNIANKITAVFQETFNILGNQLKLNCSVGVSIFPQHAKKAQDLLHFADMAMYESKRIGPNKISIYSSSSI